MRVTPGRLLFLPAFTLFVISLGYILHVGGHRFNTLITPSLVLSIFPNFTLARALGRFDIPWSLFLTMGTLIWLFRSTSNWTRRRPMAWQGLCAALMLFHVGDVYGYLVPPSSVADGNVISNELSDASSQLHELAIGKTAIIAAPALRDGTGWGLICYSLAYHTQLPLSGANVGLGVREEHGRQWEADVRDVLEGRIDALLQRYGDVLIAVRPSDAETTLSRSTIPLTRNDIAGKVVILSAEVPR